MTVMTKLYPKVFRFLRYGNHLKMVFFYYKLVPTYHDHSRLRCRTVCIRLIIGLVYAIFLHTRREITRCYLSKEYNFTGKNDRQYFDYNGAAVENMETEILMVE